MHHFADVRQDRLGEGSGPLNVRIDAVISHRTTSSAYQTIGLSTIGPSNYPSLNYRAIGHRTVEHRDIGCPDVPMTDRPMIR
jgi:hypothetical protein